jgi:hypothetical protein
VRDGAEVAACALDNCSARRRLRIDRLADLDEPASHPRRQGIATLGRIKGYHGNGACVVRAD